MGGLLLLLLLLRVQDVGTEWVQVGPGRSSRIVCLPQHGQDAGGPRERREGCVCVCVCAIYVSAVGRVTDNSHVYLQDTRARGDRLDSKHRICSVQVQVGSCWSSRSTSETRAAACAVRSGRRRCRSRNARLVCRPTREETRSSACACACACGTWGSTRPTRDR